MGSQVHPPYSSELYVPKQPLQSPTQRAGIRGPRSGKGSTGGLEGNNGLHRRSTASSGLKARTVTAQPRTHFTFVLLELGILRMA